MAETVRKNLGMVTAYAYAVSKGYTGTEEEFAELMASYADVAQDAETSAQAAAQSATTAEQKATQAAGSAMTAAESATSASESAQAAAGSSNSAGLYAQNASASATNAAGSASSASTYAGNASTSAQAAESSANDAQASATQAAGSADDAEVAKDTILGMNAVAETLPAGSQATASYSNGTLTLGIPKGDTGEKGDPGDTNDAPVIINSASGSIASFKDGADNLPLKSCAVNIEPIQEGEGNPSSENVRPISGRTGLNVVRSGKNLFNPNSSDNLWVGSNNALVHSSSAKSVTIPAKAEQVLTASMSNPRTSSNLLILAFFDIGGNIISRRLVGTGEKVLTATAPANTASVLCSLYTYSEAGNVQLELGSTATDYEPYKGSTYSVNWETEAGTVYAGTLDVLTGKLTVDRAFAMFDGNADESWSWTTATNRASISLPLASAPDVRNPVSNCNMGTYLASGHAVGGVFITNNKKLWYYPPTTVNDLESYRIWLSENNLQIVYELANPVEYQLSENEVRTLLGENNIWSDGGDISVEYPADTKTYIDAFSIKTVEVTGQTPTITAEENTRYICGEVTSLTFTPCASGICDIRFTAASISTVLTLPQTVKLPDWFDPTSLEANTTYEINIVDGVYGAVMSWA